MAESKRDTVIRIMNENPTKSRAEVIAILVPMLDYPASVKDEKGKEAFIVGYYNYGLKNGAPGEKVVSARGGRKASDKPKAEKAPKVQKAKVQKVPAPRIAGDKEKPMVTDKTVEELQDIKNKNLARLKAVGRKYYANQANGASGGFTPAEAKKAKDYVQAVTDDLDSFKAPAFLSKDEVTALV